MNPRLTMRRHGRAIAVVGALVAVSATTTMALVAGTAAAAPTATQPGKCVDNVNVRAQPSRTSKIVAVCAMGKAVQVDETRDGFVHLADLKGWAAQEYVSVNGRTPAPATRTAPTATSAPGPDSATRPTRGPVTPGTSGNTIDPNRTSGDVTSTPDAGNANAQGNGPGAGDQGSGNQGGSAPAPSPLGGLLG